MKSILVGNGVNIQFGGKAYLSEFIMKRIKYKAKTESYDVLFGGVLSKEEINGILEGFVGVTNEILDNKYDDCATDEELLHALIDFKKRYKKMYTKVTKPHDIMLEDWFFVLQMFFIKNSDLDNNYIASLQGFKELILDGIYNDGKLQEIYKSMPKKVKKYFCNFDNIFTLNYDNNLESLTGKNVYHLHGDFSVLFKSENPENVMGYIRDNENKRVIIEGMEHCFCNALLNFSGYQKLKEANDNHELIIKSENFKWQYENDKNFKAELLKIKNEKPNEYEMIITKIKYPNLKMATEYYFYEFENIQDELHIIGMSPNNDDHIFKCINKNSKLEKVYFYYFSEAERDAIDKMYPKGLYVAKSINDLWKELDCKKKEYNMKRNIPNKIDEFIKCFNAYLGDNASKDDVLKEVRNIPDFEAIRLCKLVKEDVKQRNPESKTINETSASISYIALSEGILPTALYMLCAIYFDKVKSV